LRAVRWASAAELELIEASSWYESRQSRLGAEFIAEIDSKIETARSNPQQFPVWTHHAAFHRIVVERFPYVLFFRFTDEVEKTPAEAVGHKRLVGQPVAVLARRPIPWASPDMCDRDDPNHVARQFAIHDCVRKTRHQCAPGSANTWPTLRRSPYLVHLRAHRAEELTAKAGAALLIPLGGLGEF
jgi:hypothetical protein